MFSHFTKAQLPGSQQSLSRKSPMPTLASPANADSALEVLGTRIDAAAEEALYASERDSPTVEQPLLAQDDGRSQRYGSSDLGSTASSVSDTKSGDSGVENHEYLTGGQLVAAMCGIGCVFFIVLLDFSILSTAIPYITSEFHSLQE
ncbi:uncharacterized protein CLAFUR5_04897 [Fulvia fulva]|uniref:Uncharacterized protein n=1 Tax=Passalora fulva TaxID=5499 RepID=A0A9Q8LFB6_PASFU|nr:uncharacterized protein CLAFUR5_04897 [Fulvia fulva]UJO16347.1 hypothetical protein CLAFUR5_04897 [Fulvia fulva]